MRTNSIRKTLQVTNIVIILATLVPFLINTLYYNFTLNQYERIIENVYSANSLSSGLQDEIYITIWNVVAGKTRFGDNTQYELIARIKSRLDELEKNANSEDDSYLITVARNTLDTIESYVDKIGDNIAKRPARPRQRGDPGRDQVGERAALRCHPEVRGSGDGDRPYPEHQDPAIPWT